MSLEIKEMEKEILELKQFFSKCGLELIGTKEAMNDIIFMVKKKKRIRKIGIL